MQFMPIWNNHGMTAAFPRNRWCEVRRRSQSHRARKRQERDRSCLQTSTMSADITVSDVSLCLFLCVCGQKCQKLWECLRMCWIVSECLKMFQAHLCLFEACRGSWEVPVSCGLNGQSLEDDLFFPQLFSAELQSSPQHHKDRDILRH